MTVLVVNAGSSTLKLSLVGDDERLEAASTVDRWDGRDLEALSDLVAGADRIHAVGHRIVHGGPRLHSSVRLDDDVLRYLESISDLAPLHNPRGVAAARAVARLLPDVPAVAAFDTAFHAGMPREATTYALPRSWTAAYALRRYGFHGLSHSYAATRAAELLGRPLHDLRVVTCHLGAGASLCAVREGRSVDTTMGFTPLAGLVMQTRSGSIDPGLLLWLLDRGDVDRETLGRILEHESGLRGLTGTSGDLREVLDARRAGDPDAALGFDVFVHRLSREVGAMAVATGGVDALVLTGGMGEHSPELRAETAERLGFLGIRVDEARNRAADGFGDHDISADGSSVRTLVVAAAEDIQVAREVGHVLDGATAGARP
ncbi:MAG: acetate/propionate family kinase [Nocardioides sp.]